MNTSRLTAKSTRCENLSKDSEFDFHYDLRITIQGKRVYIETRMDPDYPRSPVESLESTIYVVNVHDK